MPLREVSALDELTRSDAARLAPLVGQRDSDDDESKQVASNEPDETSHTYLPVRTLRTQYIDYLDTKVDEIEEQKDSRHYYHGAMWTPEQIRILRERRQPVATWNRTARKINGIVGLVERMRADPKALARSPKSEQGAEIATQAIRYVLDANQWKSIEPWCLLQCGIDGIAGVQQVLTQGDQGDPDIALPWVIGDEYFYDSKSYRLDFKDNRYEGIAKWLDIDEAISLFPDKEELLRGLIQGDTDLTTNADREYKWVITATKRIRLVEHWYKNRSKWYWAFYVSMCLLDQGPSPFFDERNKSCSSFHMMSCAVDHDGDRYGFVRNLKGPQDALNQGKSKMLHIANSRRVTAEKGAVDDVETARREWARPDGWVEINPGKQIKPDDTKPDLTAFSQFTEDAKAELDSYANSNIAAMQGVNIANLSGRAIELLRQPGMAELGPFILAVRAWKLSVYRGIWNAVQRYWKAERWIRVTNNEALGQFIQLNGLGLDQFGRPVIVNAVGSLDVDIVIEEGQDIGSMMSEIWEAFKGYPPGTFPPQLLIEMNPNIPRSEKNRYIAMLTPKPPPPDPAAELVKHLQLEGLAGRNAKTAAEVRKTHAGADKDFATADEKRAKAHQVATGTHLDAAGFAMDTLREAANIANPPQPQPQPAPQQVRPPQQLPLQFPMPQGQ